MFFRATESAIAPGRTTMTELPKRIRKIAADADEIFEFLADEENLDRWWRSAGDGGEAVHFDTDPDNLTVHLRWGAPGTWRHMETSVEPEGEGSTITITFVPVPGCEGICLEREILRAGGCLRRLRDVLEGRSHLVDSDNYWM